MQMRFDKIFSAWNLNSSLKQNLALKSGEGRRFLLLRHRYESKVREEMWVS